MKNKIVKATVDETKW